VTVVVSVVAMLACGGREFSGGGDGDGGTQNRGGASAGGAGRGSVAGRGNSSGSTSGGTSGGGSKGGAGGTAGKGPAGGAAGIGGLGGSSGSVGTAGMAGSGGVGGGMLEPCQGTAGQACADCCYLLHPPESYLQTSYECACSDPCYAICDTSCDVNAERTPECHHCVVSGFKNASTDLCSKDAQECAALPACTATAQCLSRCF